MKREQGLLLGVVAILGLMGWSLKGDAGAGARGSRQARAKDLILDALGPADPVVQLDGHASNRDPFVRPLPDSPLELLALPAPPLDELPSLLPPPLPAGSPASWSQHLFAFPATPLGDIDDLIDLDAGADQGMDQEGADSGFGSDEVGTDEATQVTLSSDQDEFGAVYDSIRLDAIRTFYGFILDDDRYEIQVGDPITFQQVDAETGEEMFAPQTYQAGEYEAFALARTLRNQIEYKVREMRGASPGRVVEMREHVDWLLANAIQQPIAFGYAEEHARWLIQVQPDHVLNWLTLGTVWERTFRFDEAFTLYATLAGEELPESAPDLGLELQEGRFAAAEKARLQVGMARILRRLGADAEAEALLRHANQERPAGDAATLVALGSVLLDRGQPAAAMLHFERVTNMSPPRNSPLALANGLARGRCAMALGRFSEAADVFADTLRADTASPQAKDAASGRIAALYGGGDFATAVQEAEDAIETYGSSAQLLYLRGIANAADGGAAAEVVRDLRAAAASAPLDAAPALAALAFWYDRLGLDSEASAALDQALDQSPDLYYARYLRARWAVRDGELESASEDLRRLVAEAPRCVGVLAELAWLLHAQDLFPASEVAYRRAELELPAWARSSSTAPQWADLALRRGLNFAESQEWARAAEQFLAAKSFDPTLYAAQNGLARVAYAQDDLTQAVSEFAYLQDNLRQNQEDPQFLYAQSWQGRITAHARLRLWTDDFSGSRLRPGWEILLKAKLGVEPRLESGHLSIRGEHSGKGRTRATREVPALHFQSFGGDFEVGARHSGDAGLLIALETRNQRQQWLFQVFRDRDGRLVYQWKQGAKEERQPVNIPFPTDQPVRIEFDINREANTPELRVRFNGEEIYRGAAAQLKSSAASLVYGMFVDTANALPVHASLDNVEAIYAKP